MSKYYFIILVLFTIIFIQCSEEVEKKEVAVEEKKPPKKEKPKGVELDDGPLYTKLSDFKKTEDSALVTNQLGKEKVYLSRYWESINHWTLKDHVSKRSDRYQWPFPAHQYRLWFGLYNLNDYPVIVEFEAHVKTFKTKLKYGSVKLKPKSGWNSRKMRRMYAQFQWGFNNPPKLKKLIVRVQRLDKNGNLYLAKGEKISPYAQNQINDSLWAAIRFLDVRKAKHALSKGANVNSRGTYARTPLISLAAQNWRGNRNVLSKQVEIAKLLIEKGAKVMDRDKDGSTALHWSAKNANVKILELLLSRKAEINVLDNKNQTPLDLAIIEKEKYMNRDYNNIRNIDGSEARNNFWYSELSKVIFVLKRMGGKTRFQKRQFF